MKKNIAKSVVFVSIFVANTACAEDKIELQPSGYVESGWQRVAPSVVASTSVPATPIVRQANVISGTVRMAKIITPTATSIKQNTGLEISAAARLVEDYFNGLGTLKADFMQDISGEAPQKGVFYLNRAKRQFIWQYTSPVKQRVISTGTATYFDGDGQTTQLPNNAGLARFFASKKLNLNNEGIKVIQTTKNNFNQTVVLSMAGSKVADDQAALRKVTLYFTAEKAPVLGRMEALDALGTNTVITLSSMVSGQTFARGFFDFTPGVYKQK